MVRAHSMRGTHVTGGTVGGWSRKKGISRVETYVWIRGKKRFIVRGDSDLSAPSSPHPDPPPPHPSRRNLDLQIHPGHDYFAFLLFSSFFKNANTRVIYPLNRLHEDGLRWSRFLVGWFPQHWSEYWTIQNFFFLLIFGD